MTGARIQYLDEAQYVNWDKFVDAVPGATFFHRAGWKNVIERSFDHACYYLYVEKAGAIMGILPLVHIDSRIFGNALVSTGFCVAGGPVAEDQITTAMLDCEAMELAQRLGVGYLEYRTEHKPDTDWLVKSDLYAGFCKPLSGNTDKDFADVPRKRRAMLRKAISSGMTSDFNRDVCEFYKLYAESVRNLGTPAYTVRYFQNLVDEFPDDCTILTARMNDQAVSSVLSFYFRDNVLPYFAGAKRRARHAAANDFMYWELMRRSSEQGIKYFDFGRSKTGTGAYAYKLIWGFKAEPLSYSYRLFQSKNFPEFNPTNPKYRLAIATWKRLPLPVANFFGPFIARDLG